MTDYQVTVLVQGVVKASIVFAGIVCVTLGYRLFTKGVFDGGARINVHAGSGDDDAKAWKAVVAMDKGGPGLIFALFGAIIIVVGILSHMTASADTDRVASSTDGASTPPGEPAKAPAAAPSGTVMGSGGPSAPPPMGTHLRAVLAPEQ